MKPGHSSSAASRFALAAVVALLAGCASTSLTSSWQSPDYRGGPLKNIAVFVMAQDDAVRRFAEDQVVRKMPAETRATASHTLFDKPERDKEKVRAALIKAGYDGVLVSRLVAVDKSQTYIPPHTHFVQTGPYALVNPYYGNFGGYYGQGYAVVQTTPGYTVEKHDRGGRNRALQAARGQADLDRDDADHRSALAPGNDRGDLPTGRSRNAEEGPHRRRRQVGSAAEAGAACAVLFTRWWPRPGRRLSTP